MQPQVKEILEEPVPPDYLPFPTLRVCGNDFTNVRFLLEAEGFHPLLIGQGVFPILWIWGVSRGERMLLVERNVARHPAITVRLGSETEIVTPVTVIGGSKATVTVHLRQAETMLAPEHLLIRVEKDSQGKAIVESIDLRPIGLYIYGDAEGLVVATHRIKRNTFSNIGTAFKFG